MKEDKRRKIMKAAELLFSRRRIHEITMEDVAARAGVGKGTLYRYFRDKDDLFFEVALSGFDDLCDVIRSEALREIPFRDCLVRICAAVADFHRSRRQLIHMMQDEERRALWAKGEMRKAWFAGRGRLITALGEVLGNGQMHGFLRDDIPENVLAALLLGLLRARWREIRMDESVKIEHELMVDVFLNGAAISGSERRGSRQ